MRKLNSFIDSKHPFAFLDVNNLPFYHLSVYKTILENQKKISYFEENHQNIELLREIITHC